jgi:hypothetical protein
MLELVPFASRRFSKIFAQFAVAAAAYSILSSVRLFFSRLVLSTERLPYKASDLSVWNAVLWPGGKKMKRRVAIGAARVYHFPPPPVSRLHLGRCISRTRLIVQEVPS